MLAAKIEEQGSKLLGLDVNLGRLGSAIVHVSAEDR